ncbi:MAG: DUF2339 domain-containing protein, partial [Devosiaceae bacterium]
MDELFLLALAVLAFLVLGSVLGLVSFFKLRTLRTRMEKMARELADLKQSDRLQSVAASVSDDAPELRSEPVVVQEEAEAGEGQGPAAKPPPLPQPDPIPAAPELPETQAAHKPKLDTESTIGGKLTIWVGGIALALGGLFLALYAIENAILGPTERVLLGFGFGALVAAAGEWARRRPNIFALPGFERANIPATLTAVGIFAMFGAVYAAHALYGLMTPIPAFLVLAVLALAVMALALLHGPTLAALGLLAAYGVPFLLDTTADTITVLALYVLAVSTAALGVARLRGWLWLALGAIAALIVFGVAFSLEIGRGQPYLVDAYLALSFALGFAIFVLGIGREPQNQNQLTDLLPIDRLATGVLTALTLPLLLTFAWQKDLPLEVLEMAVLFAGPLAIAYRHPALRYIVAIPAVLGVLRFLTMGVPALEVPAKVLEGPSLFAAELAGSVQTFAFIGFVAAALLLASSIWLALRSSARSVFVTSATISVIALYLVAYVRIEQLASSQMFALFGAVLCMVLYAIAMHLNGRLASTTIGRDGAIASSLIGAIVSLAFAVSVWLQGPALTIALGLIPLAAVLVWQRFPLTALRVFACLALVPYGARLLWEPLIDPANLIDAPIIFNALLWGYGIPTLAIAAGAVLLTRAKADLFAEALQAAAVFFAIITVSALSLHAIDPSFTFSTNEQGLMGAATLVIIGGAFSLALTRIGQTPRFEKLRLAADLVGIGGMLVGAFGLFIAFNPLFESMFDPVEVGQNLFLNRLGYAYALPMLLFVLVIQQGWATKNKWYIRTALAFTALLGFAWVNLTIRQAFSPNILTMVLPIEQTELYTYSVVWLAIALALLGAGIVMRNVGLRAASGLIIVAVVLKVFLLDLAELTGVLRAVSFIGLGLVLMGIGLVYQRALRAAPKQTELG